MKLQLQRFWMNGRAKGRMAGRGFRSEPDSCNRGDSYAQFRKLPGAALAGGVAVAKEGDAALYSTATLGSGSVLPASRKPLLRAMAGTLHHEPTP